MSKWQNTNKPGAHLIKQVQRYIVQVLQLITQWCQAIGSWPSFSSIRGKASLFLVGVSLSVVIVACSASNSVSQGDVKLTLVSFSVTKAAYERIIPKFVQKWKKEHNQNVTFTQSYGASGSQADAVIKGLQADVVHLSLGIDVNKIEQAGLIKPDWELKAPLGGILTRSVVAFVTRPGNPKGIKTWADLANNGVSVITANPKTSGGARWNFLGIWGSVIVKGGEQTQAQELASKVYQNAPVLPESARAATDLFFQKNQGDVLINYENEVILAAQNGQKLSYVVPDINISIDNPVVVVDKNVDQHGIRKIAEAFVNYLYTPEAQREFAQLGYRPVNPYLAVEMASKYPQIQSIFNAQYLGGWDNIQKKFFADGAIFDNIQSANKKT
ncbi:sulfate ABC transporter substrate-binding protein [Brasilonema sp. CT11]|nr:sulfate ABC transporter substrate-binding protein [Brasilonema sp. CT11]